ncbi:MAG: amino acid permease [Acidobacteria bacterium]|nr:amino acid permease [Acidobacteriota bacterium]
MGADREGNGSMIGSGIFIVSADMARLLGSGGWLLAAWAVTGLLTVAAALSYGELSSMMPQAGGQYVFLREAYSPLWGFLYGWTLFLVIQTGTIAAVGVAFARFLGVLFPAIDPAAWIVAPIHLSERYALSLSTQQLVGILSIALLTAINTRGIHLGKLLQNAVTSAKTLALIAVIVLGILVGRNADAIAANFAGFWDTSGAETTVSSRFAFLPPLSAKDGLVGLLVAFCVAQVGSLFSSDAWNNITFAAGEVKDPRRSVPRALATGTGLVIALYLLANVAYLLVLPLAGIQHAPDDRVGTAMLGVIFGPAGATIMAIAIAISTFGCNNGLILAGARVYYVMARDGLFFRGVGTLNERRVPAAGLIAQGIWASLLILPRTRLGAGPGGEERYGNLYGNLLDYVVFAVLIFYVLTIAAIFVLRRTRPDAERPYRAWGYPVVPLLYIAAALVIMAVLVAYRSETTWPGLVIVLSGLPAYWIWTRRRSPVHGAEAARVEEDA